MKNAGLFKIISVLHLFTPSSLYIGHTWSYYAIWLPIYTSFGDNFKVIPRVWTFRGVIELPFSQLLIIIICYNIEYFSVPTWSCIRVTGGSRCTQDIIHAMRASDKKIAYTLKPFRSGITQVRLRCFYETADSVKGMRLKYTTRLYSSFPLRKFPTSMGPLVVKLIYYCRLFYLTEYHTIILHYYKNSKLKNKKI